MTDPTFDSRDVPPGSVAFRALLVLLLFSGAASLVYEIVWFQLLTLVIGSSTISLGILLGTFMGGMCAGSLALPRLVSARRDPLRVYAALELGIGACGVLVLLGVPLVGRLYVAAVGYGGPGILLRGFACGVCLLVPTALMGATLPALARAFGTDREGVSRVGLLYAANLVGAVAGCLAAGFWLLRVFDLRVATVVAVAANAIVAGGAFLLARRWTGARAEPAEPEAARAPGAGRVRVVIALSGFTALAAEVVWTRQLSLLLGASVYTFSLILAVFLGGLGIGGGLGAALARRVRDANVALGACQLLLGAAIAWAAWSLARALPSWPIDPSMPASPWTGFQIDLIRCAWAILPGALLWGASFPLALAAASVRGEDAGRVVGGIYAANTVGAILGSLAAGLVLIATLGTRVTQQALAGASLVAALLALAPVLPTIRRERLAAIVAGVALVVVSGAGIPPTPPELVAYGRYVATWEELPDFLCVGEGRNASIAVSEEFDGVRNFHVSGKVVASSEPQDMRLQRMLGHLPALVHPGPKSVLVVGCGAGVTAGSLAIHPGVERVVILEIEPLIPPAAGRFFAEENHHVVEDPRVTIIYDDARHYVLTTDEKFDIVTSDPIHPWVRGAASLYSLEYFRRCREILNPGGVVTQWLPLYETTEDAVASAMATFFAAFPDGSVWSNDQRGKGYDLVLLGTSGPEQIDMAEIRRRLKREDHSEVRLALEEVRLDTALKILSTYAGRARDLGPWLAGAELNRDRNLRLQYLAGLGLHRYDSARIHERILSFRRYPEDLFLGTGFEGAALRALLAGQ